RRGPGHPGPRTLVDVVPCAHSDVVIDLARTPVARNAIVAGETIADVFRNTALAYADRPALRWRADGHWASLTWAEYRQAAAEVAEGLCAWDVRPGDRVAVLATNRPEWHIVDIAVLCAGLVSVPIYPTNAASQVAYVLKHSGARVCFVEDV